jgi:hypothetical protein
MTVCILPLTIMSQTEPKAPEGFAGVYWGESPEKAQTKMLQREEVQFDEPGTNLLNQSSKGSSLLFHGGKFLDEPVDSWVLEFQSKKLVGGSIVFALTSDIMVSVYKKVKKALHQRYGDPVSDTYAIDKPYKKGSEKSEIEAIQASKAVISAKWEFRKDGAMTRRIICEITGSPTANLKLIFKTGDKASEKPSGEKDLN